MSTQLLSRFNAPGPKRILSLDGGGIRGMISLGFLKKIEHTLREISGNDQLVLSDYFDLIGGTSTGAIIASLLSMGKSVDEIIEMYKTLGAEIFRPKKWFYRFLGPLKEIIAGRFSSDKLEENLEKHFGGWTLGDDRIQTGLCIFTTRADIRSTAPFYNHPRSRGYGHFDHVGSAYTTYKDQIKCGKRTIKLSDIIRASTAAPGSFNPKEIVFYYMDRETPDSEAYQEEIHGAFMDGGVGSLNNPALYLFLMSTLKRFPFQWKTGKDDILLVSVGTGFSDFKEDAHSILETKYLNQILGIIMDNFLQDASEMNQTVLQCVAHTPQPSFIDEELGDLKDEYLGGQRMLTYLRYNAKFNKEPMTAVGMGKYNNQLGPLHNLDDHKNIPKLLEISEAFAKAQVKSEHFENFDLAEWQSGRSGFSG